ncbi:DUF488 family protein [Lactobacillus sp. ESL0684]|uniref:DUF488 domain-containing protein n=1 Tax=Lactobacillus sp. ESL0684 TaxID=2983213 RepID=UPI0023F72317|nr:DUF488 family protein [Lactobacillus sp. ESL0684]WEV43546.1 DUF488 family protein [Lactobacillus sp. ESL0684]
MTEIKLVRIYDHVQPQGYRILVDRLWPRGMSKVKANLACWSKEIGPSNDLRKWFNHDDAKFPQFKQRYIAELDSNPAIGEFLQLVKEQLQKQNVLFLYGAKDRTHNQAVVLKDYVSQKLGLM